MSETVEQLKTQFGEFLAEDAKFTSGNGAAGTRARKALAELAKIEIQLLEFPILLVEKSIYYSFVFKYQ